MEQDLYDMIADYMEKGFLDNIIDMFKYEPDIYPVAPRLISDERMRVRLGAIALLESLAEINFGHLEEIADAIAPLLKSESTLIRGDAAYGLGIIGVNRHIPQLQNLLNDEIPDIAESALDSIEAIRQRNHIPAA
ncbi:MAG: HEAT repeat domain-containing protein [Nitrospirae bacterium]|nr:HEAT repeat domain-containing protein [Nitrospirota bacterium]